MAFAGSQSAAANDVSTLQRLYRYIVISLMYSTGFILSAASPLIMNIAYTSLESMRMVLPQANMLPIKSCIRPRHAAFRALAWLDDLIEDISKIISLPEPYIVIVIFLSILQVISVMESKCMILRH